MTIKDSAVSKIKRDPVWSYFRLKHTAVLEAVFLSVLWEEKCSFDQPSP